MNKKKMEQWGLIHGLMKKLPYVIFDAEVFLKALKNYIIYILY